MRNDIEQPEGEELSEHEQDPLSETEDKPDPADIEATLIQDPKEKTSEMVIRYPTAMKPFTIPENGEDREDREEREAYAFIDNMFTIYPFYNTDVPRFETTSKDLSVLAKEITKLTQELVKKPIPGEFPVTL